MHVLANADKESKSQEAASAEPMPGKSGEDGLIYDLRLGGNWCEETARFADRLLAEAERRASFLLDQYIAHVQRVLCEAPRGRGEYALDLLMLGLALRRYGRAAKGTSRWAMAAAATLLRVRRFAPCLKPAIDRERGRLFEHFGVAKPDTTREERRAGSEGWTRKELPRLLGWMRATGEFEQETLRLENWQSFLSTMTPEEASHGLEVSLDLFDWFEREAATALGGYTEGVGRFLAGEFARRGQREDRIFCGKSPAEYHLAMIAVEVMNRGLRGQFERMRHKAVLVPGCMRSRDAESCRAREEGTDITCSACDPACTVNRITRQMQELGAKVYIVPHATGFSRWLERWQREPDTGVTAVACLLNILPGGYEMRDRGIAAQCVPLDYPGCQKHWRIKGISTRLDEEQLVQIIAAAQS